MSRENEARIGIKWKYGRYRNEMLSLSKHNVDIWALANKMKYWRISGSMKIQLTSPVICVV